MKKRNFLAPLASLLLLGVVAPSLASCGNNDPTPTPTPVVVVTFDAIEVTGAKTDYVAGQVFSTEGMTVTAKYSNGDRKAVGAYTVSKTGPLTVDDKTVTISFTEGGVTKTADVAINVAAVKIVSLEVRDNAFIKEYEVGDPWVTKSVRVAAFLNNGDGIMLSTDDVDITYSAEKPAIGVTSVKVTAALKADPTMKAEKEISGIVVSEVVKADFTDEQLGKFVGEFYGTEGKLTITKDGATVESGDEKVELINKAIAGKNFRTNVAYKDAEGNRFMLSWADGDKKVPVITNENGDTYFFCPTVESIQGWYTGWGTAQLGDVVFILTNDFATEVGFFNVGASIVNKSKSSTFMPTANYAQSYFIEVNGNIELGWDFYYADDLTYVMTESYAKKQPNGKIDLMSIYYDDWFDFESSVSMFNYKFFDENEDASYGLSWMYGIMFDDLDEEAKTVYSYIDWDYYDYTEGYDEKGQYVEFGTYKMRGTRYGITLETADGVNEHPYFPIDEISKINGVTFSAGQSTVRYTDENWCNELYVNGQSYEAAPVIYNHTVAIKATVDEEDYYLMHNNDGEKTVVVAKNDDESIYVNVDYFKNLYVNDYLTAAGAQFVIDNDLKVTTAGQEYQGTLLYTDDYGVVLEFNGCMMLALNEEQGLYVFGSPETEEYELLVVKAFVESFYGDWTTGKGTLSLSEEGGMINGETVFTDYKFGMISSFSGAYPAVAFEFMGATCYLAMAKDQGCALYLANGDELEFLGSYVPQGAFDAIVGSYTYVGENGEEHLSLSADGTFILDSTVDEQILPVEYDYDLSYDNGKVSLVFPFTTEIMGQEIETSVSVMFAANGASASIFNFKYINDAYYETSGVYTDGTTNLVQIVGTRVVVNGVDMNVEVQSKNANDYVFQGTLGGEEAVVTIDASGATVAVGENPAYTVVKTAITLADYAVEAKNVGGYGYDVKVTADGVYCSDATGEYNQITNYCFKIVEGKVAIVFSDKAIDYTITKNEEEEVVVTAKSNIPVPPPLP